jgi:hypothetical protein
LTELIALQPLEILGFSDQLSMQPQANPRELLFELRGRVESRRVLEPLLTAPRMEISFSGTLLETATLGGGSGACTFEAQANADGVYEWSGRGILFLSRGSVTSKSWGRGRRTGSTLVYQGEITFKSNSPNLAWLDTALAGFEYQQDMATLETTFVCYRLGMISDASDPLVSSPTGNQPC